MEAYKYNGLELSCELPTDLESTLDEIHQNEEDNDTDED
jgi:hypothetical protein